MKPVCVPCQRFFRPKKNGYYFIEGMPNRNDALPGTTDAASWSPYKIWVGDLYQCTGCGAEIVSGFGNQPIGEHYQAGFADLKAQLNADQLQVNDC